MADERTKIILTEDGGIQAEIDSFVQAIIVEYQSRHRISTLSHELEHESMVDAGRYCASGVFRLKLTFEADNGDKCQSSVVLKIPQLSSSYASLQKLGLYRKEVYVYETVLSRIYQFWSGESMTATFYGASSSGILALENLQEHGFRMPPKNSLLDLTECEVVLKKLAQFHAASVRYFQLYGTEEFDKTMAFVPGDSSYSLVALFGKIRRYVTPTLSEGQLDKWTHFEKNSQATLINAYASHNVGGFNVMLHGDLNCNNLLFKDDECRMVDFQLCRRGSPLLDLTYFLVNSVKCEVFERHRKDIFNHYLGALNEVLEELDCEERYSLDELNADFEKYKLYLIYVLSTLVPFLWSGSGALETLNEEGTNKMDVVIQSAKYISLFKNWIEVV